MRTLLLGDIGNRLDIEDAEFQIQALRRSNQKTVQNLYTRDAQIKNLEEEICRQKLAIEALTRFLVEKAMIDPSELAAFIEEVDAEDGVIDGKLAIDKVSRKLIYGARGSKKNTGDAG